MSVLAFFIFQTYSYLLAEFFIVFFFLLVVFLLVLIDAITIHALRLQHLKQNFFEYLGSFLTHGSFVSV